MRYLFRIFCILVILSAGLPAMANKIFNGGFELGDSGYSLFRQLRPDTNQKLQYLKALIDTSDHISGHNSLRVDNPYAEISQICTREFKLEHGKTYCASVWLKSSVSGYPVKLNVFTWEAENHDPSFRGTRRYYGKDINLTRRWQRYEVNFTVKGDDGFFFFQVVSGEKGTPATMWVDDFCLVETGAAQSPLGIEAVVKVPKINYPEATKNGLEFSINTCNNSSAEYTGTLQVTVNDEYTGEILDKQNQKISLPPNVVKIFKLKTAIKNYGIYKINVSGDEQAKLTSLPALLAVIGKYVARPLDIDKDYCVAINSSLGMGMMYQPERLKFKTARGIWMPGCSTEEICEYYSAMGCRIMRDWGIGNSFLWKDIEQEPGKFCFGAADRTVELAKKYNFSIIPVLGAMDFIDRWGQVVPKWVQKESVVKNKFPLKSKYYKGNLYLPPLSRWGEFVRRIVERYKGTISHYEIMNEPNLIFYNPDDYVPYLRSAYDEIKKIDSSLKVIGICATGDLGGNVSKFVNTCLKKESASMDILSFHPYSARELNSEIPADDQIKDLREQCLKYAKRELPLWNTELFFLHGETSHGYKSQVLHPRYVARRFLTDLGEGIGQSIAVLGAMIPQPVNLKNITHHFYNSAGLNPSATYVTYNALARLFESARPYEKIRWNADCICYVYNRGDSYIAAMWNYGPVEDTKVKLDLDGLTVSAYDLLGNQLNLPKTPIVLDGKPVYLKLDKGSPKQFVTALKAVKVIVKHPILQTDTIRLVHNPSGMSAVCGLKNYSAETLRGTIQLKGSGITSSPQEFTLLPQSENSLIIPIVSKGAIDKITVEINSEGQLYSQETKASIPSKIYMVSKNSWGPEEKLLEGKTSGNFSGNFKIRYDNDRMFIHINVIDTTPSENKAGRNHWEQDSIELFFDSRPLILPVSKKLSGHRQFVGRMFIIPYAAKKKQFDIWTNLQAFNHFAWWNKHISYDIRRTENGYEADLTLPLSLFKFNANADGKSIGLEMIINNANGRRKADRCLRWNSCGKAYEDRFALGIIKLN